METDQILTIFLTLFGLVGFELAGRKIWWAWYINIANQVLWLIFSLVTGYLFFLIGTAFYTYQFSRNAYRWTKEHRDSKKPNRENHCWGRWDGDHNWVNSRCNVPGIPHEPHEVGPEEFGLNEYSWFVSDPDILPALEEPAVSPPIHPKRDKILRESIETDPRPFCSGHPRHELCGRPVLAHKPHFIEPGVDRARSSDI